MSGVSLPAAVWIGHAGVHPVTLAATLEWVAAVGRQRERPRLLVTPNLANIAVLEREPAVQAAYRRADLVLADGWPVAVAVSLLAGRWVPRVTGSDLLPALAGRHNGPRLRLVLIGGRDPAGVATAFASAPGVAVVAAHGGRWEADEEGANRVRAVCEEHDPDLVIIGLGSPKQELLALACLAEPGLHTGAVLCLGAAGDFVSGDQARAPLWLQRLGLEWAHRLGRDPQRLGPRYLRAVGPFTAVIGRSLWRAGRARQSPAAW